MSIPSSLDTRLLERDFLLFPMRSSPIVCVVDVLDLLYHTLKSMVKSNKSLGEALLEAHSLSSTGRSLILIREQSAIKKHPITSVLWFLGTATQAVKIFGFQGKGLWWVKAIAGMYISSYIILVGISLLPQSPSYSTVTSSHSAYHQVPSYLEYTALTLHILLTNYAIFQVLHLSDVENLCYNQSGFHYFFCNALCVVILTPTYATATSAFGCLIWGILYMLSGGGRIFGHSTLMVLFVPIHGAILFWVIYSWMDFYLSILKVGNVVIQGGILVLLMIFGCMVLYAGGEWVVRKVFHFDDLEVLGRSEFLAVVFASISILVAWLYCCFAYDPTRTIKPSWTEKLG